MTQAEKEVVDLFCRELELALRSITGQDIYIDPKSLPIEAAETSSDTPPPL